MTLSFSHLFAFYTCRFNWNQSLEYDKMGERFMNGYTNIEFQAWACKQLALYTEMVLSIVFGYQ
jgi:hypothetical protein